MRKFDEDGLLICKKQGAFFADSLKMSKQSSPLFIKNFMLSESAFLADEGLESDFASFFQEKKNEKVPKNPLKFSQEELYWIGYIYRYWAYCQEITSKQVYRSIAPAELRALYFSYHSQDPQKVIDILSETHRIFPSDDKAIVRKYLTSV
jgi:hypothetical protein